MAVHVIKRVAELGEGFILAPERYDPRRVLDLPSARRLGELVELVSEQAMETELACERPRLVLDTSHAFEGFVWIRHDIAHSQTPRSDKRVLRAGDVIVSRLRPYLRQVAYVDQALFTRAVGGNEVLASTEFYVLRQRGSFDPACLVPFLLSPSVQRVLAAGQEGGHHPRFSRELLLSLALPEPLIESSKQKADEVREGAHAVRRTLAAMRTMSEDVEGAFLAQQSAFAGRNPKSG